MPESKYAGMFKKAVGASEATRIRRNETIDIVRRLGVVTADRVFINDYPLSHPATIFNPGLTAVNDELVVFARVILGYYTYVSGIVRLIIPLEDLYSGSITFNSYQSKFVVYPTTRYDVWGVEDPRVTRIDKYHFMTYCGRTVHYFNPAIRVERTLPVTAVCREDPRECRWWKILVYKLPSNLREHVVSDKDAFIDRHAGKLYLYHRPHLDDESWHLVLSVVPRKLSEIVKKRSIREVVVEKPTIIMEPCSFELKLGWAMPPVHLKHNEFITFIHGVDNDIEAYRLFAALLEVSNSEVVVKAVTPTYIMQPQKPYEIFGDRPNTIFPCGVVRREGKLIIAYGAGDHAIGFGEMSETELLSMLDKGRIY